MDIEIKDERNNPFFERKELNLLIKHPKLATPSKTELIKELAEKQKCDADCIIVDYVFTKKGLNESEANVKIYKDKSKVPKKVVEKKTKEEVKPKEVASETKEESPKKEEGKNEAQTSEAK